MDGATEITPTASKHISADLGCLSAGVILFSCLVGMFGNMLFAFTFYEPSNIYVPPEARTSAVMHVIYGLGFDLSGAIPFTGLVIAIYSRHLLFYVPREARKGWYWATTIGALGYWFIFWVLWTNVLGAFGFFEQMMRRSEVGLLDTVAAISLAAFVGVLISLTSVLPLGVLQWLVLHQYVQGATRWAFTVIISNALITGIIIGQYCWGTRWGWN